VPQRRYLAPRPQTSIHGVPSLLQSRDAGDGRWANSGTSANETRAGARLFLPRTSQYRPGTPWRHRRIAAAMNAGRRTPCENRNTRYADRRSGHAGAGPGQGYQMDLRTREKKKRNPRATPTVHGCQGRCRRLTIGAVGVEGNLSPALTQTVPLGRIIRAVFAAGGPEAGYIKRSPCFMT